MTCEFTYRRRVEFADTDLAGIVHFARYSCYVEEAEHAFLRSLGWSVHGEHEGETIGFPRLAIRFEFKQPIAFEDEVDVHLWLLRKGTKSLTYQFELRRGDDQIAIGELSVICCRVPKDGGMTSTAIPAALADQLDEATRPPLRFR